MKVVSDNGCVMVGEWKLQDFSYKIIATQSMGRNATVWEAIDIVKRSDGKTKRFTRRQLKNHFKKVEPITESKAS